MAELTPSQQAALDRVRGISSVQPNASGLTQSQQTALDRVRVSKPEGMLERASQFAGEVAGGTNRVMGGLADIALSPLIAAEQQIRPYAQAMLGIRDMPDSAQSAFRSTEPVSFRGMAPDRGDFAGEGTGTNIAAGIGEIIPAAAMLPIAGQALAGRVIADPRGGAAVETVKNLGRELLTTTPAQEAGFGAASIVGGEIAREEYGEDSELVGAILTPLAAGAASGMFRAGGGRLFDALFSRPSAVENMALSLNSMQDEMAADLLAEAMTREGVNVNQVMAKLDSLGPDAIPADAGQSFRRLLRAATNINPSLQGRASRDLAERNVSQADRVARDVNLGLQTPGITVDQAITQLRDANKPMVDELYASAARTPIRITGSLKSLLEGSSSIGRAREAAEIRLTDRRAAGDEITHFDLIDATKQEMDDQISVAIRAGENNKVRDLIRLKNVMIEEADRAIPDYKKARNLFAGERALESAAQQGELFFRSNARQVVDMTKNLTSAEMDMFRIGARQAIMDKIDVTQINADLMKRLFGRNGDITKLKSVFPNEKSFETFSKGMEREAEFILTRRTATENSTTVQQAQDIGTFKQVLGSVAGILGSPLQASAELSRVLDGLTKGKSDQQFAVALQRAGDILLSTDMNPAQVRKLLEKGNTRRLRSELEKALTKPSRATEIGTQAARSATLTEMTGDN